MAAWYKFLLLAWVFTVIPVALLAYGFSGDHYVFPRVADFDFQEALFFVISSAWALSPALLAPVGLRLRAGKSPER
jgi:hypothetical protein